jgi:CheY-like chemotaxis protein
VTAFTSAEDRRRALDTGFQAHVAKPIDTEQLVEIVARVSNRLSPGAGKESATMSASREQP